MDVSRQSLQLIFDCYYDLLIAAYRKSNYDEVQEYSEIIIGLLDNMDSLLASDEHFLLGKWIEAARALGSTEEV